MGREYPYLIDNVCESDFTKLKANFDDNQLTFEDKSKGIRVQARYNPERHSIGIFAKNINGVEKLLLYDSDISDNKDFPQGTGKSVKFFYECLTLMLDVFKLSSENWIE